MLSAVELLNAHRAVVASQKGYSLPGPTKKYLAVALLIFYYIKKNPGTVISTTCAISSFFQQLSGRFLLQGLISRVSALITSNDCLSERVTDLKHSFNEAVENLKKKTSELLEEVEEVKKITEVFEKLKEEQEHLFNAQSEERKTLLTLFKEIKQETESTSSKVEEKISSMKEENQKLMETLRKIFSPVREYNQRLKDNSKEMADLTSVIEKILGE